MQNCCYLVLSYNHPEMTGLALRSILTKTQNPVYLIHNGSQEQNIQKLKAEFPEARHLVLPENKGFSGGVNAGFKEAFSQHNWAIFLSNDCELLSAPNLEHFAPGLISPRIFLRNTSRIDSFGASLLPLQAKLQHNRDENFVLKKSCLAYTPGAAFAIHRNAYEASLGFDESLGSYWEDVELSLRIQAAGFPLQLAPNWTVKHKVGKTCHKNPYYTSYLFQRNRWIVSRRALHLQFTSVTLIFAIFWLYLLSFCASIRQGTRCLYRKDWDKAKLIFRAWLHSLQF